MTYELAATCNDTLSASLCPFLASEGWCRHTWTACRGHLWLSCTICDATIRSLLVAKRLQVCHQVHAYSLRLRLRSTARAVEECRGMGLAQIRRTLG